jgi:hypothetical protein
MRYAFAALALLAACGQRPEPAPEPPAVVAAAPAPWFICDGVAEPTLVLATGGPPGATATLTIYDKTTGATAAPPSEYAVGESEGAAGSVIVSLRNSDGGVIDVRSTNPGMLENPSSAYTPRVSSVRMSQASSVGGGAIQPVNIECRWLPRTRLLAFTGRRTIVVHEDADGDLIYTSYDFAAARPAPIDLSENGRTTAFSLEARDGRETTNADGVTFEFQADSETEIIVRQQRDGTGTVEVRRHGPEPVQNEALIATQIGEADT